MKINLGQPWNNLGVNVILRLQQEEEASIVTTEINIPPSISNYLEKVMMVLQYVRPVQLYKNIAHPQAY